MKRMLTQLVVVAVGAIALVGLGSVSSLLAARHPDVVAVNDSATLASVKAELADSRHELQRTHEILDYSARYGIPADLSAQIYDIAVSEGIPAAVGFQLVKVESGFQNNAQSGAAAIGLTQLRLGTARTYDATVNASDLMNADVNLRLGFRYLGDLIDRFDHDIPLALEAYNKGPTFVSNEQGNGEDVEGRYSKAVMSGVRTRG